MTQNQPETLASIIASVAAREAEGPRCDQMLRLAVLRNYTVEAMVPLLKHTCFRWNLQPYITVGDYDTIVQEVLDSSSHVYTSQPDVIFVSWLLEHLDPACARTDWNPTAAINTITSTLHELTRRTGALIAVTTLLPPLHTENSLSVGRRADHRVTRVHAVNAAIHAVAQAHPDQVFVIDTERAVQKVGEDRAIDYRFLYMYRAPFKKDFVAILADEVVRIGRALKGRLKKCLVLDCDNTLWGGIIGEDGIAGIALDPHEYPGKCYYDFQQTIVNLVDQGVVVALCSKNNEDDVWEVFDTHPHCLLKRSHIAAWRVNWNDKAANIAEIAAELNVGRDSVVFVDDSPLECQIVRDVHSDVTVLQVPSRLYDLPRVLYTDGLFDVLTVSGEDRVRTSMYIAARQRDRAMQDFASPAEYLRSLQLRATIHAAQVDELPRVAQLVSKTNQFNLTTRRHTEGQIRELANDPDSAVFTLAAGDRFGDLGLVGVLIARREEETGVVDSLLVSCRALGRKLEVVFVQTCLQRLQMRWNLTGWRAEYLPTKKNRQVARFWEDMGFCRVDVTSEAVTYHMKLANQQALPAIDFISLST
jgi:FkbH-like protein